MYYQYLQNSLSNQVCLYNSYSIVSINSNYFPLTVLSISFLILFIALTYLSHYPNTSFHSHFVSSIPTIYTQPAIISYSNLLLSYLFPNYAHNSSSIVITSFLTSYFLSITHLYVFLSIIITAKLLLMTFVDLKREDSLLYDS